MRHPTSIIPLPIKVMQQFHDNSRLPLDQAVSAAPPEFLTSAVTDSLSPHPTTQGALYKKAGWNLNMCELCFTLSVRVKRRG